MTHGSEVAKVGGLAGKAGVVLILVLAVGAVLLIKNQPAESLRSLPDAQERPTERTLAPPVNAVSPDAVPANQAPAQQSAVQPGPQKALPRLVDLGADKCIPCKMMAPILEELKKEYAGRMDVEFIDVWKNPGAGRQYGVQMIPTQIFYSADGKERFRHQGYFAKEDILAKWKELGVHLVPAEQAGPAAP